MLIMYTGIRLWLEIVHINEADICSLIAVAICILHTVYPVVFVASDTAVFTGYYESMCIQQFFLCVWQDAKIYTTCYLKQLDIIHVLSVKPPRWVKIGDILHLQFHATVA